MRFSETNDELQAPAGARVFFAVLLCRVRPLPRLTRAVSQARKISADPARYRASGDIRWVLRPDLRARSARRELEGFPRQLSRRDGI